MKRSLIPLLQVVTVLIGMGTLALMLWFPHIEGRNVNATSFEIYFNDPFLAYAYLASIAFFTALYQVFKLLGYAARHEVYSQSSVKALRTIKYCALSLVGFILGAEAYLFIVQRGKDDIAGGIMMAHLMIIISVIVAIIAARFEKTLQKVKAASNP